MSVENYFYVADFIMHRRWDVACDGYYDEV